MNAVACSAPSASSSLTVQGRVIAALILREIHTLYGNYQPRISVGGHSDGGSISAYSGFSVKMFGAHAPHGMGMAVFLLCGFIPWYIFNDTVSRCMSAVRANQALLTFPQVTELDLMFGRLIVVWGTQTVCAAIILALAAALGQPMELRRPGALAATLFFAPLLGLGMGLIFASLARFWPTLERLVPIMMRFLFFASGVFFSGI